MPIDCTMPANACKFQRNGLQPGLYLIQLRREANRAKPLSARPSPISAFNLPSPGEITKLIRKR